MDPCFRVHAQRITSLVCALRDILAGIVNKQTTVLQFHLAKMEAIVPW